MLSHDEIRWLWRASETVGFPFGPLFRLLLLTGQRRDEVAGMRRSEIDRDGVWTMPKARVKNAKEHVVPLPSLAREIIVELPAVLRGDMLFPATRLTKGDGERAVSGFSKAKARVDALMLEYARQEAAERGDDPAEVEIPAWRLHDFAPHDGERTGATWAAGARRRSRARPQVRHDPRRCRGLQSLRLPGGEAARARSMGGLPGSARSLSGCRRDSVPLSP